MSFPHDKQHGFIGTVEYVVLTNIYTYDRLQHGCLMTDTGAKLCGTELIMQDHIPMLWSVDTMCEPPNGMEKELQ